MKMKMRMVCALAILLCVSLAACTPPSVVEAQKARYREEQLALNIRRTLETLDAVEAASLNIGLPSDGKRTVGIVIATKTGEPLTQEDTDIIKKIVQGGFAEETTVTVKTVQ